MIKTDNMKMIQNEGGGEQGQRKKENRPNCPVSEAKVNRVHVTVSFCFTETVFSKCKEYVQRKGNFIGSAQQQQQKEGQHKGNVLQ